MKAIENTSQRHFAPSELVCKPDGSIYHLGLHPDQIADTLLIAGDPARVESIAQRFDSVEHRVANREFVTLTGRIGEQRISALSTGIGTDNIDIVLNELDALRNIDLANRVERKERRPLRIVRIGTSGALNADIDVGSFVHSAYAIGLDGVMHFYNGQFEADEVELLEAYRAHCQWSIGGFSPYAVRGSRAAGALFQEGFVQGITATACGFYGPQGRALRIAPSFPELNERMGSFSFHGIPMANYEMESSALFALGGLLGHECTTVCLIIANRQKGAFLEDYKPRMQVLIDKVLERVL